ncbi:MAG: ImmA/IrrE family metallo-endopeptidase [Firmicutes bacterium]|nr:ImmA/IrrE family metallo-endopeptidase [Bacillota bacterium]
MNSCISNRELDELGNALVRRYLERSGVQGAERCIDIVGLANFLGLTVTYETFAEKDFDKIGFLSDGKTPLLVRRGGRVVSFLFPLGTIVLDVSLHADKESGRCRFTIAHEIAHFMIDQHRPAAQYHRTFDAEKKYSVAEMNELFNIVENQADRLAAAILMPRFTVDRALDDFYKGKRIPVYGQNIIAPKEDKAISRMAAQIGVSYSAMLIRLRQFGLLDYHPVDEYFEKALHGRKA